MVKKIVLSKNRADEVCKAGTRVSKKHSKLSKNEEEKILKKNREYFKGGWMKKSD